MTIGRNFSRPSIALLIAMPALSPFALNIFVPSMPGLVEFFNTSPAMVQLTLSLYLAATSLAQLLIGPISDSWGRRPVFLAGMVLFIAASMICRLAPGIEVLIAARIVQGIGAAAGFVLVRSIISDLYGQEKSASMIGYVTMGTVLFPMIGPAIGGYLDGAAGWRSAFDFVTALGIVLLATAFFGLGETIRERQPDFGIRRTLSNFRTLALNAPFRSYTLTSSFSACVFFSFVGGGPFVASQVLHLSASAYGLYYILIALGYVVGNFVSGRIAERAGLFAMIQSGNCLSVSAVIALCLGFASGSDNPLILFVPMFFSSFANGLTLPSAIAGAVSVRPALSGAAAGLSGSLQLGAGAVASATVGALMTDSTLGATAWPLAAIMGISAVVALLTGWFCPQERADSEERSGAGYGARPDPEYSTGKR